MLSACLFYVSFSTLIPSPHQTKRPEWGLFQLFGDHQLRCRSEKRPTRQSEKKSGKEIVCFKMIFLCCREGRFSISQLAEWWLSPLSPSPSLPAKVNFSFVLSLVYLFVVVHHKSMVLCVHRQLSQGGDPFVKTSLCDEIINTNYWTLSAFRTNWMCANIKHNAVHEL